MNDISTTRLADQTAPRYTSYPTAADFTAGVGPAQFGEWLSTLDPAQPLSLYLHVPYCREICRYCGCHAKAALRDEPVTAYRQTLESEIGLVAARLPARPRVARIAWGGGTPSILGEAGLARLMEAIGRHFDLMPGAEIAIELDPRTLDQPLAQTLAKLGFNRVSLGVQDLDPSVQEAIGRIQPLASVASATRLLRKAGFTSINFDLIFGLPGQTREGLLRTCEAVETLLPDRIAFYGYAHLPARRANQRLIDTALLPDADARLMLASTIADFFAERGYQPVGIDHFALPGDKPAVAAREGRLHRNFQGYTDDDHETLIGFGCSAISRLPGGYAQSDAGIESYKRRIAAGELATVRGHAFAGDDIERAKLIEQLMCRFSASLPGDLDTYSDEMALLRPFIADGLVERKGNWIGMTDRGQPFVRLIAAIFDRYRAETRGRFSPSV